MSHWDFGAAESEMQPPVGRRAAQPLEVIAGPLYRRGAEERTRANRQNTLDEETLATWTDWRIIFMPPSIALNSMVVPTSHLDVLRDFQGLLSVHSLGLQQVFSLELDEVRTALSWTQLSRTHTLMSYAETIFEDLRKPKEPKK